MEQRVKAMTPSREELTCPEQPDALSRGTVEELEALSHIKSIEPQPPLPDEELRKAVAMLEEGMWSFAPSNQEAIRLLIKYSNTVPSLQQRGSQLEKEHDEEIGEFQNKAKNLIDSMAGSNVDGGGSESGDWRDFTLSEIGQGLAHVIDQRDELKKRVSQLEGELKEARAALGIGNGQSEQIKRLVTERTKLESLVRELVETLNSIQPPKECPFCEETSLCGECMTLARLSGRLAGVLTHAKEQGF